MKLLNFNSCNKKKQITPEISVLKNRHLAMSREEYWAEKVFSGLKTNNLFNR